MQIKINLQIFIFIIIFILTKQIKIYAYLMFFAFVHELGHLLAGVALGLKPKTLKIMPFGISIIFNTYQEKKELAKKNFIIAIAGPMVNIIIAVIALILKLSIEIVYANILIAIFNLFPIYPLDGGRMIKSILFQKHEEKIVDKYVIKISNAVLIIFTMISSIMILYLQNIAILFVVVYLWIVVIRENKVYTLKKRVYNIIEKKE